jgi:YHS domain-containing protein
MVGRAIFIHRRRPPRRGRATSNDIMKTFLILFTASLLGGSSLLRAEDAPRAPYPLTTCIISGEKLGEMGTPPSVTYKGTEVKFCCKDCVKSFDADPDKYLQKYEQAVKAAKK